MSFGFDPLAFAVALVAIWYTIRESRRNASPTFQVVHHGHTETAMPVVNGGRPFSQFLFRIRNVGVSLHDPSMQLAFRGVDGFGWRYIPLHNDVPKITGEFTRGMIADFVLRSYQCDANTRTMLYSIEDISKQDIRLVLTTQGMFFAKNFFVGHWRDRVAYRLYRIAYRVNRWFDRPVKDRHGVEGIKLGKVLPEPRPIYIELLGFIQSLKEQDAAGQPVAPH